MSGCWLAVRATHRRRIQTEEKAKVVAAFWGTEFLAALAVFHLDSNTILDAFIISSHHPGAIHPILPFVRVQNG